MVFSFIHTIKLSIQKMSIFIQLVFNFEGSYDMTLGHVVSIIVAMFKKTCHNNCEAFVELTSCCEKSMFAYGLYILNSTLNCSRLLT